MRAILALIAVVACTPAEAPVAPRSTSSPAAQPGNVADPADGSAHVQRGKAYSAAGDYKRAVEEFTVALRSGRSAEIYFDRGSAYCAMQDRERGLADLAEAKAAGGDLAGVDQRIDECKRLRTEAERNVDGAMDDLAQEARLTFAAGEMTRARDLARIVLRHRKSDEEMLRIAAMASCKLGDRLFAPRYYAKLTVAKDRDAVTAVCAELHIVLDGPSARLP